MFYSFEEEKNLSDITEDPNILAVNIITRDKLELILYIEAEGVTPEGIKELQQSLAIFTHKELIFCLKNEFKFKEYNYIPSDVKIH